MSWITSAEAAAILSENSGREITSAYVRALAQKGFIRSRVNPKDASTNQYWLEDVKDRKIRGRTERRVEKRVRDQRTGRPPGRPRKTGDQGDEKPLAMAV